MKADELRIGNWYLGASRGNPLQATARFIQQLDEGLLNCSPIPLTPEILEKCGFIKFNGFYWVSITNLKSELHIQFYGKDYVSTLRGQFCDLILDKIDYLHQLQNLYFALCGEELIFKP